MHYPPGMPNEFNPAENGLHPAHMQLVEGFIYVNFAREEPPEFDSFVASWRAVAAQYGTAGLKVIARAVAADEGELEAGAGELSGVLPLFTVAQQVVSGGAWRVQRGES